MTRPSELLVRGAAQLLSVHSSSTCSRPASRRVNLPGRAAALNDWWHLAAITAPDCACQLPPGPHERPPARPAGCTHHVHIAVGRGVSPLRRPSLAPRKRLTSARHAAASAAASAVGRSSSSRGASAAAAWAVNGSLRRTLASCSAQARGRRDRVETCCAPRSPCC